MFSINSLVNAEFKGRIIIQRFSSLDKLTSEKKFLAWNCRENKFHSLTPRAAPQLWWQELESEAKTKNEVKSFP